MVVAWHVINYITISDYDSKQNRQKGYDAYVNALSATGKEYDDQFIALAGTVYSCVGPIEVTVRWTHKTAIPENK